ncbi:MAG: hypothetical protein ACJAWZ_004003 [Paracoccaceae bacterium]|jgi:hypothetical protein
MARHALDQPSGIMRLADVRFVPAMWTLVHDAAKVRSPPEAGILAERGCQPGADAAARAQRLALSARSGHAPQGAPSGAVGRKPPLPRMPTA